MKSKMSRTAGRGPRFISMDTKCPAQKQVRALKTDPLPIRKAPLKTRPAVLRKGAGNAVGRSPSLELGPAPQAKRRCWDPDGGGWGACATTPTSTSRSPVGMAAAAAWVVGPIEGAWAVCDGYRPRVSPRWKVGRTGSPLAPIIPVCRPRPFIARPAKQKPVRRRQGGAGVGLACRTDFFPVFSPNGETSGGMVRGPARSPSTAGAVPEWSSP